MILTETTNTHQGGHHQLGELYYKIGLDYIFNNSTLLNLGCGTMSFEKVVQHHFQNIQITSVDFDIHFEKFKDKTINFLPLNVENPIKIGDFDTVTFFELIEHIDNTDQLLRNCYDNLKESGYLIFGFPNLASIYGRIELLLGYQPHVLEISNKSPLLGTGIFGRWNSGLPLLKKNINKIDSIHHIRGITYNAMKEFILSNHFVLVKSIGYPQIFSKIPSVAPKVIMICQKKIYEPEP